MSGQKRERVQNSKVSGPTDDGKPLFRRQRISIPADSTGKGLWRKRKCRPRGVFSSSSFCLDLLSPNDSSTPMESTETSASTLNTSLIAISLVSSRVYKCLRCECLAPHRWIIERQIRAKHLSELDKMSSIIFEIAKPTNSTTNGEPLSTTKSQPSTNAEPTVDVPAMKALSSSACSLQSYHLWVITRHIRNVHSDDGSNVNNHR